MKFMSTRLGIEVELDTYNPDPNEVQGDASSIILIKSDDLLEILYNTLAGAVEWSWAETKRGSIVAEIRDAAGVHVMGIRDSNIKSFKNDIGKMYPDTTAMKAALGKATALYAQLVPLDSDGNELEGKKLYTESDFAIQTEKVVFSEPVIIDESADADPEDDIVVESATDDEPNEYGNYVLTQGKAKGKTLNEVKASDLKVDYLKYVLDHNWFKGEDKKAVEAFLKAEGEL